MIKLPLICATFACVALFLSGTASGAALKPDATVAAVLIAEAGGEGELGMRAVMEVIQNRSQERSMSFVRVVTQKWQFSCLNGVTTSALIDRARNHARWQLALRISAGTSTNLTRGSNHYHAGPAKYRWAKGRRPAAVIGRHTFYKI